MLHVLCGWIISFVSTPSMLNCTTVNSTVIQGNCSTSQCAQKYLSHTHAQNVKIKTCSGCSFLLIRDLGAVITCCGNDAISRADLPQQSNHHQSVTHTHTKNYFWEFTCSSKGFVESVLQMQLRRPRLHWFLHSEKIQTT